MYVKKSELHGNGLGFRPVNRNVYANDVSAHERVRPGTKSEMRRARFVQSAFAGIKNAIDNFPLGMYES